MTSAATARVNVAAATALNRGRTCSDKIAIVLRRARRVWIASIRVAHCHSVAMTASLALKTHPYHPGVLVR
jgi:hypothetical protein